MGQITIGALNRQIIKELTSIYGTGEAKAMSRLIFQHLKNWNQTQLIINSDMPASDYLVSSVNSIIQRLNTHEPIQYILGKAYFYGITLSVDRSTLIPRPETQELVDLIVDEAQDTPDLNALDIATGSGAIAIALSRALPFSKVEAIDISKDALNIAEKNAQDLHADIKFEHADVFKYNPQPDSFDIIVSNPPYIDESEKGEMDANVLEYEPHTALFVPDDNPLIFYKRIADISFTALHEGGRLYFEINPRHSLELSTMLLKIGFEDVKVIKDIHQRNRFISCRKPKKY